MWHCPQCNTTLQEGRWWDSPTVGPCYCCPQCGCDGLEVLSQCSVCDQWTDRLTDGACESCHTAMTRRVEDLLDGMGEAELRLFLAILERGG